MKRQLRAIVAVLMLLAVCASLGMAAPVSLKRGDTGNDVEKVQSKLKQWGYYTGAIDGIYGSATVEAVKFFQRRNGLTPDGVVGDATARAIGITLGKSTTTGSSRGGATSNDVYLLAAAVYGEARGEPYAGQVAIAAVILNRINDSRFPHTIAGVIYQPGAFTCVSDGQINLSPDETAMRAARDALNGWDPTGGAIYYYNPATATSSWIWSRTVIAVIGRHRFAI